MADTVGSTILADDYNALFERLEGVRKKHYAANGLSSSQQSALKTNIPTKVAVKGQTILTSNAKALKSAHLPSITGIPASGPISPSPKTAVPSVITATRLFLLVNS